jgi:hypothetical protein
MVDALAFLVAGWGVFRGTRTGAVAASGLFAAEVANKLLSGSAAPLGVFRPVVGGRQW